MIDVKDRVPRYKGRVKLLPVAGQADTFDMTRADDPVEVGTPINRALFKSLEAPLYGAPWTRIFTREVAGAFSWTAPDLFGSGKPYDVGVCLIGGGGSGGAAGIFLDNSGCLVGGGASGRVLSFVLSVVPGRSYSGVIGCGGAMPNETHYGGVSGINGGSTSFSGRTASGGEGGHANNEADSYASVSGSIGAQCFPRLSHQARYWSGLNLCGGVSVPFSSEETVVPTFTTECYNSFELVQMPLSAGGGIGFFKPYQSSYLKRIAPGDGGGASGNGNLMNGENATKTGCGGGASAGVNYQFSHLPGSGAAGAAYIYARKGLTA